MSKYEQFKMRLEEVEDILIKSGFNNSLRFKSQDLQKVCYLILKFSKIEKNNSISHIELIAMNVWEALRLIVGSIAGSTFFLLDYIFNWRRFSIKEVGLIKAGSKVDRFKGKSDYVFKSFSFFELSYLTPSNLLAAIRSFFKRDVCYIPV